MPDRRLPIQEWSCLHHDSPMSLGLESDAHPWEALPVVAALLERLPDSPDVEAARVEFGLCCAKAEWITTGWRHASPFEELLLRMPSPIFSRSVVADALLRGDDA